MKNKLIPFLLFFFTFPVLNTAQVDSSDALPFEVNVNYPPLSITKEVLHSAKTLSDLNEHYKPSWIRRYIAVEILAVHQGNVRKALSTDAWLTQEQKDLMNTADVGTAITINVQYIPENTLTHNDPKEINFSFSIHPEKEARYSGGQDQLRKYLQETAIDSIPVGLFEGYKLAAVKFTIDEEGRILDPHVFWSSEDEKVDEMLLKAICNMPNWEPAAYSNGHKVNQEFVLTIGNMKSCVVNLLNIQ